MVAEPDDVDRLEAPPASRLTAPAVVVLLVIVGVLVALAVASHDPHAPRPRPVASSPSPFPLPEPVVVPRAPQRGSVFLEHLDACTRTDHRSRVTVAVGVTNLTSRPLRLLGAIPLRVDPRVEFTGSRIGPPPCAAAASPRSIRLAPSRVAVVLLSFAVPPQCLPDSALAARVVFDLGGHHELHADSSQLADLGRLGLSDCG